MNNALKITLGVTIVSLLALAIVFRGQLTQNIDIVAILLSGIASVSACISVAFSIYLFTLDQRNKHVRIGADWDAPLFNVKEGKWLNYRIHNYGELTALDPKLEIFLFIDSKPVKIFDRQYSYTMYPGHNFTYSLMEISDYKPSCGDLLIARVSCEDQTKRKTIKQFICFTVSEVITINAKGGDSERLAIYRPSCVELNTTSSLLLEIEALT
ncbi:hypothetical protein [Pseudodesulfovibrio pelocollis]|uniref:hypothetical protein n=1 Tax=Pseudodesulfovibrio pelocollis TaxID=3051432 RepID=UPI00255ACA3C|nr:hypothetical protein [Pseudodesulfovibrio sp. SB368]